MKQCFKKQKGYVQPVSSCGDSLYIGDNKLQEAKLLVYILQTNDAAILAKVFRSVP